MMALPDQRIAWGGPIETGEPKARRKIARKAAQLARELPLFSPPADPPASAGEAATARDHVHAMQEHGPAAPAGTSVEAVRAERAALMARISALKPRAHGRLVLEARLVEVTAALIRLELVADHKRADNHHSVGALSPDRCDSGDDSVSHSRGGRP
jgi:hypothetical protein